ncbi:MAG: hypothetical protein GY865_19940 [candidate division Zixibacteria bacterium]|nr:hypothetical protein [candidate division Zixibacteria bacterium]
MLISRHTKLFTTLFVLCLFAFVGLVGCSKAPVSPDTQSSTTLLKRTFAASKVLGDEAYTETIVSAADGGVVAFHDVELYFPPNALSSDTLISISIPDLTVFANNFGTDGLFFNVPVRVAMNYRDADLSGIDETTIKMAWLNKSTGEWDIIDCVLDQANKLVIAEVYHFSAYALITDER